MARIFAVSFRKRKDYVLKPFDPDRFRAPARFRSIKGSLQMPIQDCVQSSLRHAIVVDERKIRPTQNSFNHRRITASNRLRISNAKYEMN